MTLADSNNILGKKILSVSLLLLAFWVLVDNESSIISSQNNNDSNRHHIHHLAVWTALHRHPPCLRIYRALLEFNLMLWGLAASLYLWKYTVGENLLGHLLFQPADHDFTKDRDIYFTESSLGKYRPLPKNQEEEADINNNDDEEEENNNIELSSSSKAEGNENNRDDNNNNNNNNDSIIVDDDDNELNNDTTITTNTTEINMNSNFEHIIPPSPEKILLGTISTICVVLAVVFSFLVEGDITEQLASETDLDALQEPQRYHQMWNTGGLDSAFALVAFCFSGHAIVPSIYNSMKNPSEFERVVDVSFMIVVASCLAIGISGYCMFGDLVLDQITLSLKQYSSAVFAMEILTWLMILTAFSKLTLTMFPLVSSFDSMQYSMQLS
jgi:hypothetical protein